MNDVTLYHGDCLVEMDKIGDGSIDAIIADLPYGTTACKWDVVIPFGLLWAQYKRIIKKSGAIVLFGSQPFTSALVMSNPKWFKYCWVWNKVIPTGHLNVKIKPLTYHEDIVVFSDGRHLYNRQFLDKPRYQQRPNKYKTAKARMEKKGYTSNKGTIGRHREGYAADNSDLKTNPGSIITFANPNGAKKSLLVHPTKKPVALLEYLVKTYTNSGDLVLDNVMGGGTTGAACINLGRQFIGIELDSEYFDIAKRRIEQARQELTQLEMV